MSEPSKESRLLLAGKAYSGHSKSGYMPILRSRRVSETTLRRRIKGQPPLSERRPAIPKLTELEEKVILERILDLDPRGFALRIAGVKDMANFILVSQGRERVGRHWARRYIAQHSELSMRFNRGFENMRAKYGVDDADIYNFDETGFMMGIISSHMVITHADGQGRSKTIQHDNREWATTIACIN